MFKIEFIKPDSINGRLVDKGEVVNVSRSIRDNKINSGVAIDYVESKPVKKEEKVK